MIVAGIQLLLAVVVLFLEYGPIGRAGTTGPIPIVSVLIAWAFTWFGNRKLGLRWSIIMGLLLDLISFLPFGSWLSILCLTSLLTDWLKTRFFEVSSLALALITLAGVSTLSGIILSIIIRSFDIFSLAMSTVINVVVGIGIYYVIGLRFRFFQRWTGRRI